MALSDVVLEFFKLCLPWFHINLEMISSGSLETIPFKEVNLVCFIHPFSSFCTHSRLFFFAPLVGPCLQFAPFVGTCYGLYPLLVRATACTHYWYMVRVVPIAGICYGLYPLLVRAIGCTHCWYVLSLVPIIGTCYELHPLLVRATGCTPY